MIFDYQYYLEDCFWGIKQNEETITLNWFAVPNATSYELYLFNTETFEYDLIIETKANEDVSFSIPKTQSEYVIKLRAIIGFVEVDSKSYTLKSMVSERVDSASNTILSSFSITKYARATGLRFVTFRDRSSLSLFFFFLLFIDRGRKESLLYGKSNKIIDCKNNKEH